MIKIVIVDDHRKFRQILKKLVKGLGDFAVVAEYEDGNDFLSHYNNEADIVLMDIKMPGLSGVLTTRQAVEKFPGINIIGLSLHAEYEYQNELFQSGAKGFVSKFMIEEQLGNEISKLIAA